MHSLRIEPINRMVRRRQLAHPRQLQESLRETFPEKTFIARTPLVPGVNDEDHIRAVLEFVRPYKNVIDYELLPYHRFGESKYSFLGRVYELADFKSPAPETLARLRAIIDEAFGRTAQKAPKAA